MCLTVTSITKKQIATEDIVCYKFMRKYGHSAFSSNDKKAYSPYRNAIYFPKKKYTSILGQVRSNILFPTSHFVEEGFHSFAQEKDARTGIECDTMLNDAHGIYTLQIYKCIIPKGAEYYEGVYANALSYCSNQIIIEKEIENDKFENR